MGDISFKQKIHLVAKFQIINSIKFRWTSHIFQNVSLRRSMEQFLICLFIWIWPQDEFFVWTRYLPNFQVRYWYLMPIFLCEKSFTQKINFKIVINKNYMVMETKKTLKSHKPNTPSQNPSLIYLIPFDTSMNLSSSYLLHAQWLYKNTDLCLKNRH